MYIYEEKEILEYVRKVKPDIRLYDMIKDQLQGCKIGLEDAIVYIRESYMMYGREFHNAFVQAGIRKLNDMEILAQLLHQLRGMDNQYFDVELDINPLYHRIDLKQSKVDRPEKMENHNEFIGAIHAHLKKEEEVLKRLEACHEKSKDTYAAQCLDHLIKSTRANVVMLHRMLEKKQEHEHAMDFGEAPTSKAWDQATSNYFDKPNPEFYSKDV